MSAKSTSSFVKKVGITVKTTRSKRGLSQMELADKVGVTQGFISKIEQGKMMPTLLFWYRFCKVTGTPVDILK